ncbi:small multi-drug export protein [candidate division WOR-3 bacterium]|nr:small multi-drug export protein [candidate division WOR-3 bacterium]
MKLLLIFILVLLTVSSLSFSSQGEYSAGNDEGKTFKQKITETLVENKIPPDLIVFLISILPIFELRGGIPVGILTLGLPYWRVYLAAVAGNMIPVLPILLFTGAVAKFLSKNKKLEKIINWWFAKTKKRSASVEKYKSLGLMLFVAIPLPITGAWTGALAAFLAGISVRHSFLAILFGVASAGIIVVFATLLLSKIGWIGAAVVALIVLGAMGFSFYGIISKDENRTRAS